MTQLKADPVVMEILLDELTGASAQGTTLTRDDLCALVFERMKGTRAWKASTSDRRVREAIEALILDGHPVVSLGDGFFLASTRSQRDAGAQRYRRQGIAMLRIAAALEGIPLQTYVTQLDLFEEAS